MARDKDNGEFAGFARRVIRAHARRVATGDVEALADLRSLEAAVSEAIDAAVVGLHEYGYSWSEIASRLEMTKQAAHQRWGRRDGVK